MLSEILKSFITLFVIMDPFASLPVFASLTKSFSKKERARNAFTAISVAGILLYIFLFFGVYIFKFFSISTNSFMIAGGIILLVIGILYVLGIMKTGDEKKGKAKDVASVPIGTPLLTGPGVITSTIILVQNHGIFITFIAGTATLIVSWILLRFSNVLLRILGHQGARILSRVMGLILAAIAVEFIKNGLTGYIL